MRGETNFSEAAEQLGVSSDASMKKLESSRPYLIESICVRHSPGNNALDKTDNAYRDNKVHTHREPQSLLLGIHCDRHRPRKHTH